MHTVDAFQHFPAEVLRDICEIAASSDTRTALNLSLVSTWVKTWTEPIIFHTVVLRSARALAAFLSVLSLKPVDFAPKRIRHLGIFTPGPLRTIDRVLAACKGVRSLACGFSLPSYAHFRGVRYPNSFIPREQHLLGLACRDDWDPALIGPAVSHLRVHVPRGIRQPGFLAQLATLPAITHFAIVYPQEAHDVHAFICSELEGMLSSKQLQLLLVQVVGTGCACHTAEVEAWNEIALEDGGDPRLVAEKAPLSLVRQWEDVSKDGASVWDAAEDVIDGRNRVSGRS